MRESRGYSPFTLRVRRVSRGRIKVGSVEVDFDERATVADPHLDL